MTDYCKPELLAQLTAGELSFDQAKADFAYVDESVLLDTMMKDHFFDPVGTQLTKGSTIALTGRIKSVPPAVLHETATCTVQIKEPIVPRVDYEYHVQVFPQEMMGVINRDPVTGGYKEGYQNIWYKFRGLVTVAIQAGDLFKDVTVNDPDLFMNPGDFAKGQISSSLSSIYPTPIPSPRIVLTDVFVAAQNQITYNWSLPIPTGVNGELYVWTEVFVPSLFIQT